MISFPILFSGIIQVAVSLEKLFDSHQRRYYDTIKLNNDADKCRQALRERRLFYCRPIHGVFAYFFFCLSGGSRNNSAG